MEKDKISKMCLLVKHEEASKAFDLDLFYTDEPLDFYMDNIRVYVPRGYLTDGATIPKALRCLFPVWDTYYQAAVFHDYLCEYLTVYVNGFATKITRSECDRIFERIMIHLGISLVKRKVVAAGVITYSHFKSIIYPSATLTKRDYEDRIRERLDMRDKARLDQKKK